jgi:hypothetical protein
MNHFNLGFRLVLIWLVTFVGIFRIFAVRVKVRGEMMHSSRRAFRLPSLWSPARTPNALGLTRSISHGSEHHAPNED